MIPIIYQVLIFVLMLVFTWVILRGVDNMPIKVEVCPECGSKVLYNRYMTENDIYWSGMGMPKSSYQKICTSCDWKESKEES